MEKPNIEKMASQLKSLENVSIYKHFTQEWGDSSTGFSESGDWCCQMITDSDITVLEDGEKLFIFIDNKLCYEADKTPEIESDIAKGFEEGRLRAKKKQKNVTWEK